MNGGIGSTSTRKSSRFHHGSTGLKFLAKLSKAKIINFNCDGWRGLLFFLFFPSFFIITIFFIPKGQLEKSVNKTKMDCISPWQGKR